MVNEHVEPVDFKRLDFGHVDLWTARDAPALAWAPLLAWVRHH